MPDKYLRKDPHTATVSSDLGSCPFNNCHFNGRVKYNKNKIQYKIIMQLNGNNVHPAVIFAEYFFQNNQC